VLQAFAVVFGIWSPTLLLGGETASDSSPSAGQTILVLRSGQTFEGRITEVEGGCIVDLVDGQIRIKKADIDLICHSLDEGYQQKRAAIQIGNVQHHLELAHWCLRHQLWGHAAAELADATVADPNNPAIAAMRHRLDMAVEPPPKHDPTTPPKSGPTNEELDRLIRSLARGTVEAFTQSVQPVLMNHCATAACHGPQSDTGLRLFRVQVGKTASRRVTQRNLYSVLSYVDRDNPTASTLLTLPSGPHGTAKHAVFNEHQAAQYKRLVDWTCQLTKQPLPDTPATVAPSEPIQQAGFTPINTPPNVLSQEARQAHPISTTENPKKVKRGADPAVLKAAMRTMPDPTADQFDPEDFNRRYGRDKQSPEQDIPDKKQK